VGHLSLTDGFVGLWKLMSQRRDMGRHSAAGEKRRKSGPPARDRVPGHYPTGLEGTVEIESRWTAWRRESEKRQPGRQQWLPPFENREGWGTPFLWPGEKKPRVGHPPKVVETKIGVLLFGAIIRWDGRDFTGCTCRRERHRCMT
jgi:hypothetical protein